MWASGAGMSGSGRTGMSGSHRSATEVGICRHARAWDLGCCGAALGRVPEHEVIRYGYYDSGTVKFPKQFYRYRKPCRLWSWLDRRPRCPAYFMSPPRSSSPAPHHAERPAMSCLLVPYHSLRRRSDNGIVAKHAAPAISSVRKRQVSTAATYLLQLINSCIVISVI